MQSELKCARADNIYRTAINNEKPLLKKQPTIKIQQVT